MITSGGNYDSTSERLRMKPARAVSKFMSANASSYASSVGARDLGQDTRSTRVSTTRSDKLRQNMRHTGATEEHQSHNKVRS